MNFKPKQPLAVAILAAGKGTRMESDLPKVLHEIGEKPMICHVIQRAVSLGAEKIISIIGYQHELVKETIANEPTTFVLQLEQLGTGHAVLQCASQLSEFDGSILVLSGDVPLVSFNTLQKLLEQHETCGTKATLLSAIVEDATGYGRVIRNPQGNLDRIVEHKDANEAELSVKEMNAGIYVFDCKTLFTLLPQIGNNNAQGEYYLPDVLSLILEQEGKVAIEKTNNITEIQGVNTVQQLKDLDAEFQKI
jgi:bifunctional UDP-N-acetylglucosamine pyrophosphorylase/glucosamine-1-phosphate N-acetyltransferase